MANEKSLKEAHVQAIQMNGLMTRQALRKAFRDKRTALTPQQQKLAALKLVEQYALHDLFKKARNVALYLPFNGELDTRPLIDYLWSQGCKVFIPIIHPFCAGHLLFQQFTLHTKMHNNHFGIAEPKLNVQKVCPLQHLDLMLTPLVAFDLNGNRLGMGGGFYDRTLASLQTTSSKQPAIIVGLAHDMQLAPNLPTETWDIPLPHILTSSKLYSFS